MQSIPQPVCAKVHALATAAGCQLVATCDLAVAAESAGFATPGGKGGFFCHTPLVAVARNIGRKRALELGLTGDTIDAATAADWGLINRAVPDDQLDAAVDDLMARATRGSASSKALGKRAFYAQVDLDQAQAYEYATHVMAAAATTRTPRKGSPPSSRSAARLLIRVLDVECWTSKSPPPTLGRAPTLGPVQATSASWRRRLAVRSRWLRTVRGVTLRSAATTAGEPTRSSSRTRSRSRPSTPASRASAISHANSSHADTTTTAGVSSSVRGSIEISVADRRRRGAVKAR